MNLNERIAQLDYKVQDIQKVIVFIKEIQQKQPDAALLNSRRAAEALCKGILLRYNQPIQKTSLDPLIAAVSKLEEVPEYIIISLRTIQHFGNLGAHHKEGEEINEHDITPCLQALANVINWYCEKIYNVDFKATDLIDANKKLKKIQLENKNRLERLSFCLSLDNEDPEMIDLYHDYIKIERFDVLNFYTKNFTSHRWLRLRNASEFPTEFIQHQESGENKINYEQLNLRAYGRSRKGQPIAVENLVRQQPSFVQKVRIYLPKRLEPGEECGLYYRISWPGEILSYSGDIHSQSISFTRYSGYVGELDFAIFDQTELTPIKCVGINRDYSEEVLKVHPEYLKAEEVSEFSPIHGKGYTGFIYKIAPSDFIAVRVYYYTVTQRIPAEEEEF